MDRGLGGERAIDGLVGRGHQRAEFEDRVLEDREAVGILARPEVAAIPGVVVGRDALSRGRRREEQGERGECGEFWHRRSPPGWIAGLCLCLDGAKGGTLTGCAGRPSVEGTRNGGRVMLLKGKVAIVYGGGGAVGGAVAKAFAREGARVFLAGRTRSTLEGGRERHRRSGDCVAPVDATDKAAVEEHLAEIVAERRAGEGHVQRDRLGRHPGRGADRDGPRAARCGRSGRR